MAQNEKNDVMIDDSYDVCKKLSSNGIKTRSQSKLADWLFLLPFLKFNQVRKILCYMKLDLIIPKT